MKKDRVVNKADYDGQTGTSKYDPADAAAIRQNSEYAENDKPVPDNNIFFEERSNPLSSKGN